MRAVKPQFVAQEVGQKHPRLDGLAIATPVHAVDSSRGYPAAPVHAPDERALDQHPDQVALVGRRRVQAVARLHGRDRAASAAARERSSSTSPSDARAALAQAGAVRDPAGRRSHVDRTPVVDPQRAGDHPIP